MKHIEVSAAILINEEEILCLQRGGGKQDYISFKYEFPGGKLELGEHAKEALKRELAEEMNIAVEIGDMEHFMTVEHEYPDFSITLHSFLCLVETRTFDMLEHVDFRWSKRGTLDQLDWAAADWPIVEALMNPEAQGREEG